MYASLQTVENSTCQMTGAKEGTRAGKDVGVMLVKEKLSVLEAFGVSRSRKEERHCFTYELVKTWNEEASCSQHLFAKRTSFF